MHFTIDGMKSFRATRGAARPVEEQAPHVAARGLAARLSRRLLSTCRTVHVYLSVLGLTVMLFFGITGFTAYHEDWFSATEAKWNRRHDR
jgi:hypothetical protein